MNPFTNKSLPEIREMVPGLSDTELNAAAAKYCYGCEIRLNKRWGWQMVTEYGATRVIQPTTDGREAMRLLEGKQYRLRSMADGVAGPWCVIGWQRSPVDSFFQWTPECDGKGNLCRAITYAAVIAELTKRIEGDA